MGHLGELRKRITYSAIVVVVFIIAAFIGERSTSSSRSS